MRRAHLSKVDYPKINSLLPICLKYFASGTLTNKRCTQGGGAGALLLKVDPPSKISTTLVRKYAM